MSIVTLIIIALAIIGIVWAYPRLPWPGNLILVIVVAVACVIVLMKAAGIDTGIQF